MARNLEPACKQCRRVGEKLFLKGDKCFTPKCPVVRRGTPPGQHGQQSNTRLSTYGVQLREKQKARKQYGLLERQFRLYFARAMARKGNTGDTLLQLLEQRLDNVVYRLGLGESRAQARQLIRHGHIRVNGQRVDIPSFQVSIADEVSVKDASRDRSHFQMIGKKLEQRQLPAWLEIDPSAWTGKVVTLPSADELRQSINPQLIVEFYSR